MHPAAIAERDPGKIAIRLATGLRTYRDLDEKSRALARLAGESGACRGEVMAIWAGNHIDFLTCAWAGQRSGLYYLPIAASLTPAEAAYILADSGAKLLIVDLERAAHIPALMRAQPSLSNLPVYSLGDAGHAGSVWKAAAACLAPDPEPCEGGDMLYTSGTTGKPKGVRRPISYRPLGSDTGRVERLQSLFGMDADTVFLSPAPLYHAAPLRFAMTILRLGGTVALLPRFDAEAALDAIVETGATHTQWVPTMFTRLLALHEDIRARYQAPAHRKAIHAGAPCPETVKRRMIDWFGPILHEYYSGTESIGFTHIDSENWLKRPGSVGQAWGCKIHILDEAGCELGPEQTGHVYFEGKGGLAYHNDAAKTLSAHTAQGWATMGDVGYVDTDGFLYLTDRRDFTIISGGVNVYPREVEECLLAHPGVTDAAVFGLPDPDFGEVVQAVIQARSGADEVSLAGALFDLCRDQLAPAKRPKRIAFLAALPLTDSGKIQKRVLQQQFEDPATRGLSPERTSA